MGVNFNNQNGYVVKDVLIIIEQCEHDLMLLYDEIVIVIF